MRLESTLAREQAQQEQAVQYEAARRQLARALAEVSAELELGEPDPATAQQLAIRRAAVIEEGLRFFGPLRRFVRYEVERWADPVAIDSGQISIDDVIASIYLAAVDQADDAPSARSFYTWLRRIARREARAAVLAQEARQRAERSLHGAVAVVGEWPDHVIRLISILADPQARLPESILEDRETWDIFGGVLRKLPEQWREVFLLSAVDGWADTDIAAAEGLEVRAVRAIVDATRTFLRDWLQDDAAFAGFGTETRGATHAR
jgi:RNA polymerase sigma factor (sigma-70 family)